MATKVVVFLTFLISPLSQATNLPQQCIDSLCNVSFNVNFCPLFNLSFTPLRLQIASGCDQSAQYCLGTGFAYCGPFRLSYRFWKDAGSPGHNFKSCIFDYECSVETINLYMDKYARDCNSDGKVDCDDFAAIHLAGGESSCSQKWLYSSSRYKKYLTLMSLSSRTRGVNVYEPSSRASTVKLSHDEVDPHDTELNDGDVAYVSSNVSGTPSAALRDPRRINFPARTTRVPSTRRYTVIYWNGNRRRLPEITNILDNNPWIIETARRTSTNNDPVDYKPPISRRTYFNPSTASTTPLTTAASVTSVVTTPTTPFVPITVTRRRRVRPRTRRPSVVNNSPSRRPSNRRPSTANPVEPTQPMSSTAPPSTEAFTPSSTSAPATITTTLTRVPSRRPVTSPVTERPVRSTTPQAWWMAATRRRFPINNWIDTETTRVTNPWSTNPSTTPPSTRRIASRTTSTTTPMTTIYQPPATERPTTIRTTTVATTSRRTTPPTTLTSAPATSTVPTTYFTETATSRHVTFGPHRGRGTTEPPESTVAVAATTPKKNRGSVNDSSVTINDLTESCMECICSGSSETCNFNSNFKCNKEDECGPYRIDYAYWYEAGYPNFKGNGDVDFHECATNRQCAEKTVRAYLEKNKLDCNSDGMIDCIDYAAVHKAGPDECHKQFVYESKFWTAFTQCHGFDIFKKR